MLLRHLSLKADTDKKCPLKEMNGQARTDSADNAGMSIRQYADANGKKPDTAMKQIRRTLGAGYTLDSVLSADDFSRVFGKSSGKDGVVRVERTSKKQTQHTTHTTPPAARQQMPKPSGAKKGADGRVVGLYSLMLCPALASMQNVYIVAGQVVEGALTAALLTVLLSASPFAFVLLKIRTTWAGVVTVFLVAFEAFCNVARIYGGLTNFGKSGNPTQFLGLITEIFGTGTYHTAQVVAAIVSCLTISVFYGAYSELQKS